MRVKIFDVLESFHVERFKKAYVEYSKHNKCYVLTLYNNDDDWFHIYTKSCIELYSLLDELNQHGYADATKWFAVHKDSFKQYCMSKDTYVTTASFHEIEVEKLIDLQEEYIHKCKTNMQINK